VPSIPAWFGEITLILPRICGGVKSYSRFYKVYMQCERA
jgi:hypothetical protein